MDVDTAAAAVREAGTAVALTGAGVSTASGIPDFRGEDGVWQRRDPGDFHVRRFRKDPEAFWDDWLDLRGDLLGDEIAPNDAHRALADLEAGGHLDAVVTQNVDGLHRAAGSERVVHLHGTGDRVVCRSCGATSPAGDAVARARDGEVPPRCGSCAGVLKPDTVLFGEPLPRDALAEARSLLAESGAVLVAGSSLTVEPAGSLPHEAPAAATVIVVNLDPTPLDDRADHVFHADVTEVLPRLRDAVLAGGPDGS